MKIKILHWQTEIRISFISYNVKRNFLLNWFMGWPYLWIFFKNWRMMLFLTWLSNLRLFDFTLLFSLKVWVIYWGLRSSLNLFFWLKLNKCITVLLISPTWLGWACGGGLLALLIGGFVGAFFPAHIPIVTIFKFYRNYYWF